MTLVIRPGLCDLGIMGTPNSLKPDAGPRVEDNMSDSATHIQPARPGPPPVRDVLPLSEEILVLELVAPPPALDPSLALRASSAGDVKGWRRWIWDGICSIAEWFFGAFALILGLAFLAAMPILQFLTLGYLLEAGGRVVRTGRLRDGFIGVRKSARLGSIVLGAWLMLLPLRYVSSQAMSAEVIDPGGKIAQRWETFLTVLTILMAVHIVAACSRGGKLRHFFWPFNPIWLVRRLRRGGYYTEARDAVWDFVNGLRLPYYFWLGCRGFFGTLASLIVPVLLIAVSRHVPVLGFIGALLLGIVLLHLPFLQMRFAAENRFGALFEYKAVRRHYRRAPWAFALAFFLTLLLSVPLYLLKIEMIPREVAWLPSLVFLVFMYPTRLLTGWAYGRSCRHEHNRHWFFRWTSRLWMLPTAAAYVIIVFFTQYLAWEGVWSLLWQHAFLVPGPFMDM